MIPGQGRWRRGATTGRGLPAAARRAAAAAHCRSESGHRRHGEILFTMIHAGVQGPGRAQLFGPADRCFGGKMLMNFRVPREDVEPIRDMEGIPIFQTTPQNRKRRKSPGESEASESSSDQDIAADHICNEENDPNCMDLVPFDTMPSQNQDTLSVHENFVVRRIPAIPNLLSLSEVDFVLRGAFRAPRGFDCPASPNNCGQDNRRKRLGVRLPPSAFSLRPGTALRPRQQSIEEPPPNFIDDELALEPLILCDGGTEVIDEAEADVAGARSNANIGNQPFVVRAVRLLQQYRQMKGLPAMAVVVEPFLCR